MTTKDELYLLLEKYLDGACSAEEIERLYQHFGQPENEPQLAAAIQAYMIRYDAEHAEQPLPAHEMAARVYPRVIEATRSTTTEKPQRSRRLPFWRYAGVAAAIIVAVSVGIALYVNSGGLSGNRTTASADIPPGTNRATLMLENGKVISLDSSFGGIVNANNQIAYENGGIIEPEAMRMATITVPVSGQYKLVLSDGTKVWMNAASSLSYPISFGEGPRVVKLTGEAYFEVAEDRAKPFMVETSGQMLQVLGTKFNVSAYNPLTTVTTLVAGSVQLKNTNNNTTVLTPGQQASLTPNGYAVREVSATDYTAWTTNLFVFNDMRLDETFAQLERWYDVKFDYDAQIGAQRIYAEIPRDRPLSAVLQILEQTVNIKLELQERRVKVAR